MDDPATIRERYLEAEGLASYIHRNLGSTEIRRSLDDIPVLLDRIAALEHESAALQAALDWLGSLPETDVAPSYVWTEMMRRLGRLSA